MTRTETKQRIIRAAAEIIHRKGYNATTIEDVLDAAGVKKGNLYYYFSSKEDLGLAVLDFFHESHLAAVRTFLENQALSPRERLHQWMTAMAGRIASVQCHRGCPFGNLALELSDSHEAFRKRIAEHFGDWQQLLADTVRAGQYAGELNPDLDADQYAVYVVTLLEGAILMAKLTRQIYPLEMAFADMRGRLEVKAGAA